MEPPEAHGAPGGLHRQLPVIALRLLQRWLGDRRLDRAVAQSRLHRRPVQSRPSGRGIRIRSARGLPASRAIISAGTSLSTASEDDHLVELLLFGKGGMTGRRRARSIPSSASRAVRRCRNRVARPSSRAISSSTRWISCCRAGGAHLLKRRARTASLARRTDRAGIAPAGRCAVAEDLGQLVVVSGARDDAGISRNSENRAPALLASRRITLRFAAVDDHVGDGFSGRWARPEMASR